VQQSKTTLDAAQEKEKAGIGIRVDVLQAESEYNQSLYDLESARGSVEDARAKLALATGLRPDAPFQIEENLPEPPLELKEAAISAVIDAAITNRSDLQGLRAQLRASEAAIRSANSDLWPSLSGGVEAGMNKYSGDDRPYDDDYSVIAYVSLSWNIFDGFLDINKKRAAEAARDAARSGLKQAALSAGADVWSSYYAYQTAVKKYQAAKASETSAQAAFDLANDSYKAGLKSILDLLDAQTNLADARSQLINARQAVFTALADLEHATGQLTAKSTVKREEATP
jgi:outer membrane protein TolC